MKILNAFVTIFLLGEVSSLDETPGNGTRKMYTYTSLVNQMTFKPYTDTTRLEHATFTIPKCTVKSIIEIDIVINSKKINLCQPSNVYLSIQYGSLAYVNPYSSDEGDKFRLNRPFFQQFNFTENTTKTFASYVLEFPRFGTWYVSGYSFIPGSSMYNLCVMFAFVRVISSIAPLSGTIPSPSIESPDNFMSIKMDSNDALLYSLTPQPNIRDLQFKIFSSSSSCPVHISAGVERINDRGNFDSSCTVTVNALQGPSSQVFLYIMRNSSGPQLDLKIETKILTGCGSKNVSDEILEDRVPCVITNPLNYVNYMEDFTFKYYNLLKGFFSGNTISIGYNTVIVLPFYVQPNVNQGGTLKFKIVFFPTTSVLLTNESRPQLLYRYRVLYGCASQSLPPLNGILKSGQPVNNMSEWNKECAVFMKLVMNEMNATLVDSPEPRPFYHELVTQEYFMPYPSEGMWYFSLLSFCQSNTHPEYCGPSTPTKFSTILSVEVVSQPCVEGTCLNRGTCDYESYRSIYFSRCRCTNGFDGINCQIPYGEFWPWMDILMLTMSNLFFIPSIIISIRRYLFVPCCVYIYTMIISIMYHTCDTGYATSACVFDSDALSFSDFYGAVMSLWITVICMAMLPPVITNVLYLSMALLIVIGVNISRYSVILYALPLGIGVGLLIISWSLWMVSRWRIFPPKKYYLYQFLPASVLAITGMALFAVMTTKNRYTLIHSFWHMTIALAIALYLPSPHSWLKEYYVHPEEASDACDGIESHPSPPKVLTEGEVLKEGVMIVKRKLTRLFRRSSTAPV